MTTQHHETGRRTSAWLAGLGAFAGVAHGLNYVALHDAAHEDEPLGAMLVVRLVIGMLLGPALLLGLRALLRRLVAQLAVVEAARQRYLAWERWTWIALLLWGLGAFGIHLGVVGDLLIVAIFACAQLTLLLYPTGRTDAVDVASFGIISSLFMASGFAALIYQVAWQRALFTAFGVNIESITIIVSLFMFGLGVGAMVGGVLSHRFADRLPGLFLVCELAIGVFGLFSLALIDVVSAATLDGSLATISLAIYALLSVPTMFMGATLPILVAHLNAFYRHTGKTVGVLYFLNTIGSALACFATTDILFVLMGLQSAVWVAAICNLVVGVAVFVVMIAVRRVQAGGAA